MNDTDRRNLNNTKNSPLQNNESGSLDNNNNIKLINLKSKKIIKNVEETEKEENTQYDEKYISKKNEEEIKNEDIIRKLLTLRKIKKGYSILNDPSDINENKDVSTMRKDQNAMENSDEVILNKILNWKEIKTEGEIINKKSNSNDDRIEINENQKQLKRYTINNVSDIINKHFIDLEKIKKENEINEALKENFDNEMLIQNLFDWKKVKKEDEMSEEINSNEIENDDETKNKKIEFNNEILINDCFNWKIIKQENENREEENNKENLNNEFLLENFINWKEIKHENIIHEMKNEDKSEEGKKVLIKDLVDFKEIEMEKAMSKEENKKDKKGLKLSKEKEKYSNNNNDTFPKQEIKNKGKEKDFTFDSSLSRKNETISNLNDLYENSKLASPLLSTSTLPSSLSLTIKELNGNDSEEETLLSSHNFEEDYDKHFSIPIPQENNFPTLEDVEAASSSSNVITSTNSTSKISIIDEYNSDLSSVIPGTTKHDQKFLLLSSPSPSLSPSQSMDLIQLKKENTIQSPLIFSCSSDNEEKRGKKDLITLSDELPNQTIFNPEEIHLSSTFNELSPNMNSSSFVSNSFHSSPPSISSPNSKLSFSLPSYNNLPLFEDNMEQDFKDDINSKDLDQNKESIHHHYNNDEYDHLIIKSLTNTSLSNTNISDLLIADRNNSSNEPEEVCINNNNNKREMYSSNSENSKENNTTNATPEETYIYSKNMQSSSSPLKEFSDFIDEINNEEDSENEEKNQTFNQKDDIPQNKTKKKENNKSNPSTPSNDMNDQNYSIEDNFLLFIQDYLDQGDRVWEFV
ncbi:hypothetical protein BCR36DRAFT_583231 [Piromyces finnis]|uniref:Uncharacterized protein n=1 Tax=Piromyces finnis TaxID=1754191 RepID=A0A1Y1VBL8_9FUNG|nr:hypothetical protein BCR36DRAFT_583231 [Piromyces finnis]|eukprot:ORX50646.1 hypothetical protein BCR36DRAFT_583231 [Piromyces finnis]